MRIRVFGAITLAVAAVAMTATVAEAGHRYEKVCGTFGTGGKVRAHNTSCREAEHLVRKFWRKSQSHGSPLTIDGFACKGRFHHGKYEVTCNKGGGKKLVRWRGGMGRALAQGKAARGPTYTPKLCLKPKIKPGKILIACGDGNGFIKVDHYSFYNGREAGGKGRFFVNTCTPSCGEGTFRKYDVKFRLTKPRRDKCGGDRVRYFHVVKVDWKGARPFPSAGKHSKFRLYCFP